MSVLDTPRGPVDSSKLGKTLMHEHIYVFDQEIAHNLPKTWNDDERHAQAVERLQNLKARGIDTIVDCTTFDLGRDVADRLRAVAVGHMREVDVEALLHVLGRQMRRAGKKRRRCVARSSASSRSTATASTSSASR